MPQQDTTDVKDKILSTIRTKGPGLPVQIARAIQMSPLFAGAFLSELVSEKQLKMSHMKVGGSPLYLIPGQEPQLEKFIQYLNHKEKEAFTLLKQKKFLQDSTQHPAIRVALRGLKDFAMPFKHEEQIYWRFFTVPANEFKPTAKTQTKKPLPKQIDKPKAEAKTATLDIFDKKTKSKKPAKQKVKRKFSAGQNNKFFDKIKQYLQKNSIDLLDIESFSKNTIILKVAINNQEQLLIAYNKRRINERDIIQASKKAAEKNMRYTVLGLGKPAKKTADLVDATKNLTKIREIE